MEWALDARDPEAVGALRREVVAFLRRHAEPDSDLAGAEIVVAELLVNAFQHAPGPAWVRVAWAAERPRVEVHDLGAGFVLDPRLPAPAAERGRGLFLVSAIAEDVARLPKPRGGSRMVATLPVRRRVRHLPAAPTAIRDALPAPEEAEDDGTFGREPVLRALVVELARAVEAMQGPEAAEAVVAQVGANVGGRMEETYRRARRIAGRLSPEQLSELYVRLKAAMGGGFYVVEADERRIVLGNRRCPFGAEAVQREPGLCRLTTSVLGGIAARNAGRSSVVLEERIALGDPECRVVVWLGEHAPGAPVDADRHLGPAEEPGEDPALVEACRAALHGREFLYPEAVAAFMRDFLRRGEYVGGPKDLLTRREREVLTLIADSLTGREIAGRLVISEKTVERHRGNILLKLGLRDRVALTRYAIRRGLIEA